MRESIEVGTVGSGRSGLKTAGCLSYLEHRVRRLYKDEGCVGALSEGRIAPHELRLDEFVEGAARQECGSDRRLILSIQGVREQGAPRTASVRKELP